MIEDLQMLRRGGLSRVDGCGDLSHRLSSPAEHRENPHARGIAQRARAARHQMGPLLRKSRHIAIRADAHTAAQPYERMRMVELRLAPALLLTSSPARVC